MKYKDFKSWMSNEKSKEIEALEALAQYKIKSKKKPIAVGDVVRSPYVKADVLTSIDAKNDLYYIQVYDGRVPNSVHGEDFRKYFQHVTAKPVKTRGSSNPSDRTGLKTFQSAKSVAWS